MTGGAEGVNGVGVAVAGTTTLSDDPEVGGQVTLTAGSSQAGGFLHSGVGSSKEIASIKTDDVKSAVASISKAVSTVTDTLGLTKTNDTPKDNTH